MMAALAPGGRCAVVVPEGLLFGSTGAHVELRRKLVEEYDLLAVISLPAGVFKPYTGVKTGILVFRKPQSGHKEGAEKRKIWFYEIRADGYDPDKVTGGGRPETPERNDIPDLLAEWKKYKASGFKTPPGLEASILLAAGSAAPRCWWATITLVAQNDYILAAGRYKPQVAASIREEDPAELIEEVLGLEREIVDGLEQLLDDLKVLR